MDFLKGFAGFAHWLPRLALFAIFGYHGLPKITETAAASARLDLPGAIVFALGLAEIAGALLIVWGGFGPGWATQLAACIFCAAAVGALVVLHAQHGWSFFGDGGTQLRMLVLATSFYYATKADEVK